MRRKPGVFAPSIGINVSDLIRKTAADMERVGRENRRKLDDQGYDYSRTDEWYVLARVDSGGRRWSGETFESVRVPLKPGEDPGFRSHIMIGQLSASGPNERAMIAELHMLYARRLLERKVCGWDEARKRAAEVTFKVAETTRGEGWAS